MSTNDTVDSFWPEEGEGVSNCKEGVKVEGWIDKEDEGGNGLTNAAVAMGDRQKAMGTAMGNGQLEMGTVVQPH